MNFFTKTKILITVIIVLSAIIIAMLGTIGFRYVKFERRAHEEARGTMQPGQYMAKQLKLTPEQMHEFDSLRENFHAAVNKLSKEIQSTSRKITEEIVSENPNRDSLMLLADSFGQLQKQQKTIMINHLLDIKGECSRQQKECFTRLLKQMEQRDRMDGERHRNREHNKEKN